MQLCSILFCTVTLRFQSTNQTSQNYVHHKRSDEPKNGCISPVNHCVIPVSKEHLVSSLGLFHMQGPISVHLSKDTSAEEQKIT